MKNVSVTTALLMLADLKPEEFSKEKFLEIHKSCVHLFIAELEDAYIAGAEDMKKSIVDENYAMDFTGYFKKTFL